MSVAPGGVHYDWPLSRDEKKSRILQLYDMELKVLDAGETAVLHVLDAGETAVLHAGEAPSLPAPMPCPSIEMPVKRRESWGNASESHRCNQSDASGFRDARLSWVSTNTGHSDPDSHGDDQLGCINEEVEASIHFGPLNDEINAAIHSHSAVGGNTLGITARFRHFVADAAAILQVLPSRECSPHPATCRALNQSNPPRRRAVSEGVPAACAPLCPSLGLRESRRRTSRGSRSRQPSVASVAEDVDSDGTQGDTEEAHGRVDVPAGGRSRRRSWQQSRGVSQRAPSVDSEGDRKKQMNRSRSMPPVKELQSLQNFLGETVPMFPFCF